MDLPETSTLLHVDDLIDDREVADADRDRLAHDRIAAQLASLVTSVKAPANVALYGPWGSGKSGIANLLRTKLHSEPGVKFAKFDAFKYAENPLRRNFVSAVAKELGRNETKFHDDLYSGRTRTDIKVPTAQVVKLLGIFAGLILALTAILALVVAVVALVQHGKFGTDFRTMSKSVVAAGLLPAALLTALIALVNKSFQVDRSVAKPDSDEQFEKLFQDLVDTSKASLLVVFVDELDRCSADEVVATLDAIRTFLGVPKCIFIIAADQRVLEEALTQAAKQETPADEVNPYYSTGSAYLDKVFQYQISLPPLLAQSVTHFAAGLVEGLGGVWSEVNSDYVVSVLVPTHVTSPRRVKHLLNTFALTYRLAEDRHRLGLLAEDPHENAASVARLVCLRVEFPLFARDLTVDARLPEHVLALLADKDATFGNDVSEQAQELARSYALGAEAPSQLISSDEDGESAGGTNAGTAKQHNLQLLNYLRRTKPVQGPSRDLVFMHSPGTVFGLDGELALAIENASENADIDELSKRITALDEPTKAGAVQLLAQQMRSGIGLTAPNAARSLLLLLARDTTLPVAPISDAASESLTVLYEDAPDILDEQTIGAAWHLSTLGTESGSAGLRQTILAAVTDPEWLHDTNFLLEDPIPALEADPDLMSAFVAEQVVWEEGDATIRKLGELPDDALSQVLQQARGLISERLQTAASAWEAHKTAVASPTPAAPAIQSAAVATPDEDEPFDPAGVFTAIRDLGRSRATSRPDIAHEIMLLLLSVDHINSRDAVEILIPHVAPTADPTLIRLILTATKRRKFHLWPKWFPAIESSAIEQSHAAALKLLTTGLWEDAVQPPAHDITPSLSGLVTLIERLPDDSRPSLTTLVLEQTNNFVADSETAATRTSLLRAMPPFVHAGLIDPILVAQQGVSTLEDTFAAALPVLAPGDPFLTYVIEDLIPMIQQGVANNEEAPQQIEGSISELSAATWVEEPQRTELLLRIMNASGYDVNDLTGVPTPEDITALVTNYGKAAASASALWMTLYRPNVDEFALLYSALIAENVATAQIADAANTMRGDWSKIEQHDFVREHLAKPDITPPTALGLRVLGLADCDESAVADILIERFNASTNNPQRQTVIDLWKAAKIQSNGARKRLIEAVIIGLLRLNVTSANTGAVELALAALDRLGPPLPFGVKGSLGQALDQAIADHEGLEKRALTVMPKLGYNVTTSGLFRRKKKVDYSE